jgi:predicted nucleic acid-binding protein
VLACALAAKAQLIVSGDKDLLVIDTYRSIAIVNAAQAIERIEQARK